METLIKINDFVNGIVWGVPIMLLILGTGVYYTVRYSPIRIYAVSPSSMACEANNYKGF